MREYDDVFVYWILPDERWQVDRINEVTHDRIKKLYFYYDKKQYHQVSMVPKEWYDNFGEAEGKYYWDAILTECLGTVPLLRANLYGYNETMVCKSPIFVFHGFLMSKDIHGAFMPEWLEFAQAAGMYGAFNFFPTAELREQAVLLSKRYFQPSLIRRMLDNSFVLSSGIDSRFIDQIIGKELKKHKRFTLNFSGRTTDGYKFPDVVNVYDYVFKSGADVDVVITSPTQVMFKMKEDEKKYSYMKTYVAAGRETYLGIMSKCHVFIFGIAGTYEIPITVLEQLYCGVLGIFKRGPGIKELLPEWYPEEFFYDSKEEAYTIVKYIKENYDKKYKKLIPKLREFVRGYDVKKVAVSLLDKMNEVYATTFGEIAVEKRHKFVASEASVELVLNCLKLLPDEFTFDDFNNVVKKIGRLKSGVMKESRTGRTKNYFYRILKKFCVDKCDSEMPVFINKRG